MLYASHLQRQFVPEVAVPLRAQTPELTVTRAGIQYAWVYRNTFGKQDALRLLDDALASGSPNDVVLFVADVPWAADYPGKARTELVSGPPREDYVQQMLQRAAQHAGRVCTRVVRWRAR